MRTVKRQTFAGIASLLIGCFLAWASAQAQDSLNISRIGEVAYWDIYPRNSAIGGNYLYVAESSAGLRILDISTASAPFEIGYCYLPGPASGVALGDHFAYLSAGMGGLCIVDVADPNMPMMVGSNSEFEAAAGLAVSGNYAYVLCDYTVKIADISQPTSPTLLGQIGFSGYAQGIAVSGNYAYVVCEDAGFWIVDVSNPAQPTEVGH
jgi:hypothetical protein